MKFIENPDYPMVCESEVCIYRKECANHRSAGDYRTEDGFKPEITKISGETVCLTEDRPPTTDEDVYIYGPAPENYQELDRGFLTQKEFLTDTVADYQI